MPTALIEKPSAKPITVDRFDIFDQEFLDLLERARPYMTPFQQRSVQAVAGSYVSTAKADEVMVGVYDHIHEGVLNAISRKVKTKHKAKRLQEIEELLAILVALDKL